MSFRLGYSGPVIESLLDKAINCTIINNGWTRYTSSESNPCNLNELSTPGNYTISYWTNGPTKLHSVDSLTVSVAVDTDTNEIYQTIYDNGHLYTRKTSDEGTFVNTWEEVQSENEIYVGTDVPVDPQDNYLWVNTNTKVPCIRIYNATSKKWMDITPGGDMAEKSIYDPQGYETDILDYMIEKTYEYGYTNANREYEEHENMTSLPLTADAWEEATYGDIEWFDPIYEDSFKMCMYEMAYSDEVKRFVATGIGYGTGAFLYSDDGMIWNEGKLITEEYTTRFLYICGVIWSPEKHMFVGLGGPSGNAAYSYDGINWNIVVTGELFEHMWTSVRYLNNKFIAFEAASDSWYWFTSGIVDGVNKIGMVYSEDGINWTQVEYASYDSLDDVKANRNKLPIFSSVAYGNGMWIGVRQRKMQKLDLNEVGDEPGDTSTITGRNAYFSKQVGYSTTDIPLTLEDWTYVKDVIDPNNITNKTNISTTSGEYIYADIIFYNGLFYSTMYLANMINSDNEVIIVFKDIHHNKMLLGCNDNYNDYGKFFDGIRFYITPNELIGYACDTFFVIPTININAYSFLDQLGDKCMFHDYDYNEQLSSLYSNIDDYCYYVLYSVETENTLMTLDTVYGNGIYVSCYEVPLYAKGRPSHLISDIKFLYNTYSFEEGTDIINSYKEKLMEYPAAYVANSLEAITENGSYQIRLNDLEADYIDHIYKIDYKVEEIGTYEDDLIRYLPDCEYLDQSTPTKIVYNTYNSTNSSDQYRLYMWYDRRDHTLHTSTNSHNDGSYRGDSSEVDLSEYNIESLYYHTPSNILIGTDIDNNKLYSIEFVPYHNVVKNYLIGVSHTHNIISDIEFNNGMNVTVSADNLCGIIDRNMYESGIINNTHVISSLTDDIIVSNGKKCVNVGEPTVTITKNNYPNSLDDDVLYYNGEYYCVSNNIEYLNEQYAGYYRYGAQVYHSTDGVNWEKTQVLIPDEWQYLKDKDNRFPYQVFLMSGFHSIQHINDKFYAFSSYLKSAISDDGITWKSYYWIIDDTPVFDENYDITEGYQAFLDADFDISYTDVIYFNGYFYTTNYTSNIMYKSADGINWSTFEVPFNTSYGQARNCEIIVVDDKVVTIGEDAIYYTTDFSNWSSVVFPDGGFDVFSSLAYENGVIFIYYNYISKVAYITDITSDLPYNGIVELNPQNSDVITNELDSLNMKGIYNIIYSNGVYLFENWRYYSGTSSLSNIYPAYAYTNIGKDATSNNPFPEGIVVKQIPPTYCRAGTLLWYVDDNGDFVQMTDKFINRISFNKEITNGDIIHINSDKTCTYFVTDAENIIRTKTKIEVIEEDMPSQQKWNTVCYGNGMFVTVAYNSNVFAYSYNGISWNQGEMPSSKNWGYLCYGNGIFVSLIFNNITFAYSTDGINWTEGTMPSKHGWVSICYGNDKFVAIDQNHGFAYSTDGINWIDGSMPVTQMMNRICYGNGMFVVVGSGGTNTDSQFAYSTDGINWTKGDMPICGYPSMWYALCYGNGMFVALSSADSKGAYSYDGITWELCDLPGKGGYSVCYGNGMFVALALNNSSYYYSTDGIHWDTVELTYCNRQYIYYADNKFIIPHYSQTINFESVGYDTIEYITVEEVTEYPGLVEYSAPAENSTTATWDDVINKPTNFSDLGFNDIYTSTEIDEILNPITEKVETIKTSVDTISTVVESIPEDLDTTYETNLARAIELNNKLDEMLHTIGLSDKDIEEIVNMYKKPSLVYKRK